MQERVKENTNVEGDAEDFKGKQKQSESKTTGKSRNSNAYLPV